MRIDIFAKTNLSTELRPIEMRATLKAQPSSTAESSIRDFLTFGTLLSLPEDSADVIVDAPGGLGGTIIGAAISLRPHEDSKENAQELRLLILDNKMKVIDELPLERDYISFGSAKDGKVPGAETKLADSTGVLTVALRAKFSEQATDINFQIAVPQKMLAVDVLPTRRFLTNIKDAHRLIVAPRFGAIPYSLAVDTTDLSKDFLDQNSRWYELTKSLVEIQDWASFGVKFPDLSSIEVEWINEVNWVGKLLQGIPEVAAVEQIRTHHEPFNINGETNVRVPISFQIDFPEGVVEIAGECSFVGILLQRAVGTEEEVIDEWEVVDRVMYVRAGSNS